MLQRVYRASLPYQINNAHREIECLLVSLISPLCLKEGDRSVLIQDPSSIVHDKNAGSLRIMPHVGSG